MATQQYILKNLCLFSRHIEIQIFGFGNGDVIHLYERDCSLQRRFQKIVEESFAPGRPDDVRQKMAAAACKLAAEQNYAGAGTVELIVDAETFDFYFFEMNTRIQVEHPFTELLAGRDLFAMQLQLGTSLRFAFTQKIPMKYLCLLREYWIK